MSFLETVYIIGEKEIFESKSSFNIMSTGEHLNSI